jgi:hypothetical protein
LPGFHGLFFKYPGIRRVDVAVTDNGNVFDQLSPGRETQVLRTVDSHPVRKIIANALRDTLVVAEVGYDKVKHVG